MLFLDFLAAIKLPAWNMAAAENPPPAEPNGYICNSAWSRT